MKKPEYNLTGVRLKLGRAEDHIAYFREEVEAWRATEPFSFRDEEEHRADGSVDYTVYAEVRERPPERLALVIGDAVQNMRAALEYFAYELSSPAARKEGTSFPIFKDEADFKKSRLGLTRIASIHPDERELIERVQPFAASKIPGDDPLAVLQKLSNRDKHRLLVPMIAAVNVRESWIESSNADVRFTHLTPEAVEDGAKVMSVHASPKDPQVEMVVNIRRDLQVGIAETGIVGYEIDALSLLEMLHFHVARSVIAMWFDYGAMPRTWKEVEAASTS
jgi:hypothetical protein